MREQNVEKKPGWRKAKRLERKEKNFEGEEICSRWKGSRNKAAFDLLVQRMTALCRIPVGRVRK